MAKITIEHDGKVKVIETDIFVLIAERGSKQIESKGIASAYSIQQGFCGTNAQKYALYRTVKNLAEDMAKKEPMFPLLDLVSKEAKIEIE